MAQKGSTCFVSKTSFTFLAGQEPLLSSGFFIGGGRGDYLLVVMEGLVVVAYSLQSVFLKNSL